jgi:hypothetical protein
MRQLTGVYMHRFNHRHGMAVHLFQGHYKAIQVQQDNLPAGPYPASHPLFFIIMMCFIQTLPEVYTTLRCVPLLLQ